MILWFPLVIDTCSIDEVITRYKHSTLAGLNVLIAILACALAGCWEEIHYTPPPAGSTPHAGAPTEAEEQASNFADDVANSLAGETASAVGEPASSATTPTPTPPLTAPTTTDLATEPIANPARSPRRMAWLLGSNLSLAALANDRAAEAAKVADWFDKSERLSKLLGTTVAELPPRPTADQVDAQAGRAMEYLFDQGQIIGRHLAAQYGDDHAALFELALKSNILLVLYQPGAPVVKALSAAISQAGERAKVPPDLWQPLLGLIDEGASVTAVRDAVFQMHADVDSYLTMAQP